jgi:large subunit ribosomal protein L24
LVRPGKSRKAAFTMPVHRKAKTVAGHLNDKLKKEIGKRAIALRKGDVVVIERGEFRGKEGKITKIDRLLGKIFIEKIVRKKSDGTEFEVSINPSNIVVVGIEKGDKKRLKVKGKKSEKHE